MKLKAALLVYLLLGSAAFGQVQQGGSITPGHAVQWTNNGIIQDAGTAASGTLTSLGVTNNGGPGICVNSAPITTDYNSICMSVDNTNGGMIAVDNHGSATGGISFLINGAVVPIGGTDITVGATLVSSGTNGYFLYNNNGTLGNLNLFNLPNTWTAIQGFSAGATVPTATPGDSSTTIANTAFVQNAVIGGGAIAGANTMLGNWTSGPGTPISNAMPSCPDTGGQHLNYVSSGGITCGTGGAGGGDAGTLTGTTLASNVVTSSLTRVGTLVGGSTGAGFTVALATATISGALPAANLPAFAGGDVTSSAGSAVLSIGSSRITNGMILNNTIDLSAKVSNVLPVANGGTGASTASAAAANLAVLALAGGTMSGSLILFADPTTNMEAATKHYVDLNVSGSQPKAAVVAGTLVAGTLASDFENTDVIDGVTLATGNRILIKNQAAPAENGIYTVNASGAPTRAVDATPWSAIVGASTLILGGSQVGGVWTAQVTAGGTINSTPMPWVNTSIANAYSATAPITLTGSVFSISNGAITGAKIASNTITNTNINGSTLDTVGTITSGVWHGTAIGSAQGGTGQDFSASTGVPLYTAGTAAIQSTSGSGNILRVTGATAVNLTVTGTMQADLLAAGGAPIGLLTLTAAGQPAFYTRDTTGIATHKVGRIIYDGGNAISGGGWTFQKTNDSGAFVADLVTINSNTGNVGILTTTAATPLEVVGAAQFHPAGTGPDNGYNGSVHITQPTASGQYINMVRAGTTAWSIGMAYNTSTFGIGIGQASDSLFTAPFFNITTAGNVGIGTTSPSRLLALNSVGNFYIGFMSSGSEKWVIGVEPAASNRFIVFNDTVGNYPLVIADGTMAASFQGSLSAATTFAAGTSIGAGTSITAGTTITANSSITSTGANVSATTFLSGQELLVGGIPVPYILWQPSGGGVTKNGQIYQQGDLLAFASNGVAAWTFLDLNVGALGFGIAPVTGTTGVNVNPGIAIGNTGNAIIETNPYVDSHNTMTGLVVKLADRDADSGNPYRATGLEFALIGTILSTHNTGSVGANKVGTMGSAQLAGPTSGVGWGMYAECQLDGPGFGTGSTASASSVCIGTEIDSNNWAADRSFDYGAPSYGLQITGASQYPNTAALFISSGLGPATNFATGIIFVQDGMTWGIDFSPDIKPSGFYAAGAMRVPNNVAIAFRDTGGTSVNAFYLDTNNRFQMGGGYNVGIAGLIGAAAPWVVCWDGNGLFYQDWNTGCAASSARFKQNIESMSDDRAFDIATKLQPVTYQYRPEQNMGDKTHMGFTAEQAASVDPELATYDADGKPYAVKNQELGPIWAGAIRKLRDDNAQLRARVEALERNQSRVNP